MLPLPNLNNQDLKTIIQQAVKAVSNDEQTWNDFDIHDPGITFLELFSVLKQGQMEQLNTITVQSLEKYLKLLGLKRRKAVCATTRARLNPQKDTFVPKGLSLKAGEIVYETKESCFVAANQVLAYGTEEEENRLYFYDVWNLSQEIPVFKREDSCFYISMEKPLPKNRFVRFYFHIQQKKGKRNPPDTTFLPLSCVVWEYYDEMGQWQNIEVQKDETYAFLYSGSIVMKVNGVHTSQDGRNFCIRARCTDFGYEISPKLDYFIFNSVDFIQKETKCEPLYFTYEEFQQNNMMIQSFLPEDGEYELFVKKEGFWTKADELGIDYMILDYAETGRRFATSDREKLKEYFKGLDLDETVFLVVLYKADFYQKHILGLSDGTAFQEFLVKDEKNTLYEDFELMIKEKEHWNVWKKTETLDGKLKNSKSYMLNAQNCGVRFGNNKTGKAPTPKSEIAIIGFSVTKEEMGFLRQGVLSGDLAQGIEVFHFQNGAGGQAEETVEEMLLKIKTCMDKQKRAVTVEDYVTLAMKTPGLNMGQVTVLPCYKPGMKEYPQKKESNVATLVVESREFTENKKALEAYVKNVRKYMEKYRMITTRIYVMTAEYMPVDIYVEVRGDKKAILLENEMKKRIYDYIENCQRNGLGEFIYYGELYTLLEEMNGLEQVKYLQISAGNELIEKNVFGDFRGPHYARVYVRKCEIAFF